MIAGDMRKIFIAMNNLATYFGDPALSTEQIKDIITDVYRKVGMGLPVQYDSVLHEIVNHKNILLFAAAKGSVRFTR